MVTPFISRNGCLRASATWLTYSPSRRSENCRNAECRATSSTARRCQQAARAPRKLPRHPPTLTPVHQLLPRRRAEGLEATKSIEMFYRPAKFSTSLSSFLASTGREEGT